MKFFTLAFVIIFTTCITPHINAAEIGYKIPFGKGSQPKKENEIENIKSKNTGSAWTGIGLIILGAAIVAAAIIITNEVDDVTDDAKDEVDSIKAEIKSELEERGL